PCSAPQRPTLVHATTQVVLHAPIPQLATNVIREGPDVAAGVVPYTQLFPSDLEVTNNAPETFPIGQTIVTYTAVDAAGNTGTATQTVTVVDETAPVVTAPATSQVASNANCESTDVALGNASATDNCTADLEVTNN